MVTELKESGPLMYLEGKDTKSALAFYPVDNNSDRDLTSPSKTGSRFDRKVSVPYMLWSLMSSLLYRFC